MAVLERESWVRDRGAAATVIDAAPQGWSTAFSVHRRPDGTLRYVTKINEFLGDTVATGTSASPAGPFSRTPVAHYPSRVRPGENLYTALALPSLPLEGGGMLMSICRNSMHLGTVLADAEFYKPQFFEGPAL